MYDNDVIYQLKYDIQNLKDENDMIVQNLIKEMSHLQIENQTLNNEVQRLSKYIEDILNDFDELRTNSDFIIRKLINENNQ